MANQGILASNNYSYISLVGISAGSAAFGLDQTDNGILKLQVLSSNTGAIPTGTVQMMIDPSTNGNITFSPNGSGRLIASYMENGSVVSNSAGNLTSISPSTSGYVLTSNGPTSAPSFQAVGGSGVTSIAGTTNQITASASTGPVTLSTPSTFIAPGTIASTTTNAAGTNFLLPTTTSTAGQILLNGVRVFSQSPSSTPPTNTLVGANAGNLTGLGDGNTCIGSNAGTNIANGGIQNTCVGQNAGLSVIGNQTTYLGTAAGGGNSGGNNNDGNTGLGFEALLNPNAGSQYNTAVGASSMGTGQNTGGFNTSIGANSLQLCTSGASNWAGGRYAMQASTTGSQNTACGSQALVNLAGAGNNNVILGYQAGSAYTTTESGNIIIGQGNTGTIAESNVTRIGYVGGSASQTSCFVDGINGVTVSGTAVLVATTGKLGIAVSSKRFKKNVETMSDESADIYLLRPVNFEFKDPKVSGRQWGLIAEEVAEVLPDLVNYDEEGKPYSIKHYDLPALLLNELQKLNRRVQELERQVKTGKYAEPVYR